MARFGTGIQAGLGRIDYTPFLKGSVAGSEALGRGIAALGAGAGSAIDRYQKNKQQEELEKQTNKVELASLDNNIKQATNPENKDLYADAPTVTTEQIDDLKRRANSSNNAERAAAFAEISALNQGFKRAPSIAIQRLQFNTAKNTLAEQNQDARNRKALSEAILGLPSKVSDIRTVQSPVVTKGGAMVNQSPELFPPLRDQAAASVGNVPNKPPANIDIFLFPDTLKGRYALRTDLIDQTSQALTLSEQEAKRQVDELKRTLEFGRTIPRLQFGPMGAVGLPTPKTIPLSSTEYEATLNQYNAAKAQYQDIAERRAKFNELQAEANKFAGAPLEVPAGKLPTGNEPIDEIPKAIANATGQSVGSVKSIIEPEYKAELRSYEESFDRPLTGTEKAQRILLAYAAGGGQITPKIMADIERMTQDEVRVINSGNFTFVSVGGQPFEMVNSKDPSVAQKKYDDTQEFAFLVDAISQGDSLESFDPKIVDRARQMYITRPYTNALTGTMMNFEEYINSLRPANKRQQNPGIVTPITPSEANKTSGTTSSGLKYSATLKPPKG